MENFKLKRLATFKSGWAQADGEYRLPLNCMFGVEEEGACRWFHPPEDQSGAPRFSQDHKRNLISDVKKQQAWLRFILRVGSEDSLHENREASSS
jgi:hypothetical protein